MQAKSAPLNLTGYGFASPVERLEHVLAIVGSDAESAIFDRDAGCARAGGLCADANPWLRSPVLDRVADQILNRRSERRAVANHLLHSVWIGGPVPELWGNADFDRGPSALDLGAAGVDRVIHERGNRDRDSARRRPAGCDAGELQHAFNRFPQPAGLALNRLAVFLHA